MTPPAPVIADGIRAYRNPRASPPDARYADDHAAILNDAGFNAAWREIRQWPGYAPTPLVPLSALAARLGVAGIFYKDESHRFGLKSFKALGGAYAVYRQLALAIAKARDGTIIASRELLVGAFGAITKTITVTCATDGNHGRSVAWGAERFGCRCVIFVHERVSAARREAIARYGAEVIVVPGNYDDSVRHAAAEAEKNGWIVVSDTTYDGYRDIPVDVMHGYGVLAREVVTQVAQPAKDAPPPTHVIVQAGVGGLAAAVCASFWIAWGARRPRFIVVEPSAADCCFESGLAGAPVAVGGELDTVMAGLACGEVSPLAWRIVDAGANAYAAIDDRFALDAMRALATPQGDDPALVAGETGGCGLALLLAADGQANVRDVLELDASSRVLLLGTEGDTDPALYREIVGDVAAASA